MDNSLHDLAIQYFGACEFIAQQTRQIIEEMEKSGHKISCIFMSGGQSRNGLLMRLLADCTGLPVIIPRYIDAAVVSVLHYWELLPLKKQSPSIAEIKQNQEDRHFLQRFSHQLER